MKDAVAKVRNSSMKIGKAMYAQSSQNQSSGDQSQQ